jgi:hypothetical protein
MNREELFAAKVRLALNQSASRLDDRIVRRLEQARGAALARHKPQAALAVSAAPALAGTTMRGNLPAGGDSNNWWRASWLIPVVAVLLGVALLHQSRQASQTAELAKLDAEMLADELPISAYLDKGFHRYLQQGE